MTRTILACLCGIGKEAYFYHTKATNKLQINLKLS